MAYINNILNMDLAYPGIGIKPELSIVRAYLGLMESNIKKVADEYIEREEKKYVDSHPDEYQYCYLIAEEEIPRIIRNPSFVAIYSLLESSIVQLLKYAQEKEGKTLKFKDLCRGSLLSRANKYMESILNYDFKYSIKQLEMLANIYKIRNFIVHENADLDGMSNDMDRTLMKFDEKGYVSSTYIGRAGMSSEFLTEVYEFVESVLSELMSYMEKRYFDAST